MPLFATASGTRSDRPEFQAMLEAAGRPEFDPPRHWALLHPVETAPVLEERTFTFGEEFKQNPVAAGRWDRLTLFSTWS